MHAGSIGIAKAQNSRLYAGQSIPGFVAHPGLGIMCAKMPPTVLSSNAADVESLLRGLGSTNLEVTQPIVQPQMVCLPMTHIYRPQSVILPESSCSRNKRKTFCLRKLVRYKCIEHTYGCNTL